MAPALPVYTREEIKDLYPHLYPERSGNSLTGSPSNCELYSLIQNQCTYDGNRCVCVPFKRVFARCLDREFNSRREVVGYKLTPSHRHDISRRKPGEVVYRNIEITDGEDNDYAKYLSGEKESKEVNADLLKDFLRADKIFQRKVREYYKSS